MRHVMDTTGVRGAGTVGGTAIFFNGSVNYDTGVVIP